MKRILVVNAVVTLPVAVEIEKRLVDESDVGLSEDDVLSSMDSEIREMLRIRARERMTWIVNSKTNFEVDVDEYDVEVYNEEDLRNA